jgi:hypothetical protein
MPMPPKVQPGDLITSDFMNQIIEVLMAHEKEITDLQGATPGSTGPVGIASISPATPRMGDEVLVKGHGFGFASVDVATVAGQPVALKQTSRDGASRTSDGLLIFDMPAVPFVPAEGRTVSLRLQAAAGPASFDFLLLPAQAATDGTLTFGVTQPNVPTILPGFTYDFVFALQAISTRTDTYTVTASAGQGGVQWPVSLTDDFGATVSRISIPLGTTWFTQKIHARVAIPGNATGTGTVAVTITCDSNPAFNKTQSAPINVNAAPAPNPSFTGTLLFGTILSNPNQDLILGSPIKLPPATETDLTFGMIIQPGQGGTSASPKHYKLDLQVADRPDLWNATVQTPSPVPVTDPPAGRTNTVQVNVVLHPVAGAPLTKLTLTATQVEDGTVFGTAEQQLQLGQQ